jgi:hypothetical protein
VEDVAESDGTCGNGTCNLGIISMTVRCPHVDPVMATLSAYGSLGPLMDEMYRIGQRVASSNSNEGEGGE